MKLVTGYVLSSFAADGRLKIRSYSGEYDHFRRMRSVTLRTESTERRFRVTDLRLQGTEAILKLAGIDTVGAAQALRGWEVVVSRHRACRRRRNEYYDADLCGCTLRLRRRTIGVVRAVWHSGSEDILEVADTEQVVRMIALRRSIIGRINIARRLIRLRADWVL